MYYLHIEIRDIRINIGKNEDSGITLAGGTEGLVPRTDEAVDYSEVEQLKKSEANL